MSRRRPLPRYTPTEWGVRVMLAVIAGWLGYGAVIQSLAYAIRNSSPELAYRLSPDDGRVSATLSQSLAVLPNANAAERAKANMLAVRALSQEATAIAAVVTLGIDAQVRGAPADARRWFAYSNKLSRRDLITRLWWIEDAVARGDIPGTLHSYDIALRTSKSAPDILYPVLVSAISDPLIRKNLIATLAARPAWASTFLDYAAGNGSQLKATAALFQDVSGHRIPISATAPAVLINRLVVQGYAKDAWSYYATITPNVDHSRSRDPRFTAILTAPSVFDWMPSRDIGINAVIQRSNTAGVFSFSAAPSTGGILLRQAQMLPAGDYLLEGHSAGIEQSASSLPYWALGCSTGREFGRVDVPISAKDNGHFVGKFTVPAGCELQYLTFVARASDAPSGLSGELHDVRLYPMYHH